MPKRKTPSSSEGVLLRSEKLISWSRSWSAGAVVPGAVVVEDLAAGAAACSLVCAGALVVVVFFTVVVVAWLHRAGVVITVSARESRMRTRSWSRSWSHHGRDVPRDDDSSGWQPCFFTCPGGTSQSPQPFFFPLSQPAGRLSWSRSWSLSRSWSRSVWLSLSCVLCRRLFAVPAFCERTRSKGHSKGPSPTNID